MGLKNLGQKYAYTDREVMLYAVGIGMGADPMDEKELAFVNEGTAVPRDAEGRADICVGRGVGRRSRRDESQPRDGGRRRARHHLPPAVSGRRPYHRRIPAFSSVFDKGKDKGAVILHKTVLRNDKGEELATLVASRFARGDGGFGGPSEGQPEPHKVPTRAPDRSVDISTAPGPGAGLPAVRRPQSAAQRSRIRQARRLSRSRSCTACAPTASPAAACCRPMPITIPAPSGSTSRGSRRRSIPARP